MKHIGNIFVAVTLVLVCGILLGAAPKAAPVEPPPLRDLDGGLLTPEIPGSPDDAMPGLLERRSQLMEVIYGMRDGLRARDAGADPVEIQVLWIRPPKKDTDMALAILQTPDGPVGLIFIYVKGRWDVFPGEFQ